jgi:hypothetical protein
MLPLNQIGESKNRRRQLWETKARRIKVRRKLKSRKRTPRRSTKKISPAISSSPSPGEHHRVNFDCEGRRKNSHWDKITVKVVKIRGKANPPWDRGPGWPFSSAGKAGGKSKGVKVVILWILKLARSL